MTEKHMKTLVPICVLFLASICQGQWNVTPVLNIGQTAYVGVAAIDMNTVFASGRRSGVTGGFILRSTNGGSVWTQATTPTTAQIAKLHFPPGSSLTGYAIATVVNEGFKLLKTTDGGGSWSILPIPQYGFSFGINDVFFTSPEVGFMGVRYGNPPVNSVFKTTNGGGFWTEISVPAGIGVVGSMTGDYGANLYAAARDSIQQAVMLQSTDSGESWIKVSSGRYNLQKIIYRNGQLIGTARDSADFTLNVVVRGTFSGAVWTWDSLKTLLGDANDVAVVSQTIFVSTNHWNGTANVGVFYHSGNGGSTWQDLELPSLYHISAMAFVTGNSGYAVGDSSFTTATCFKTTNGGGLTSVRQLDENVPAGFQLEQNYPNPFNPSTTFTFYIQHFTFVILKVYDLLGREVATLVNEHKAPGSYEVIWNASGFASGVYFYRLHAGGFTQTKRLLLLR
jgi:photosystem II stability/assembly factor-like uncharacterized protein